MRTQSTDRPGRHERRTPPTGRRGLLDVVGWLRDLLTGPDRAKGIRLLVVPAVGLAVLGGIGLWQPTLINSVRTSWQAAAFALVTGGLIALGGLAVARLDGPEWLSHTITGVVAAIAVGLTVTPTLTAKTVDDELTEAAPTTGQEEQPSGDASAGALDEPTEVGQAPVRGIDHEATGTARILRLGDGSTVVRFESLDVEPGPDYFVYLVPGTNASDVDEGTRLGKLKAPRGNQNYEVPPAVDVNGPVTVLIWCRAFSVPVANATIDS